MQDLGPVSYTAVEIELNSVDLMVGLGFLVAIRHLGGFVVDNLGLLQFQEHNRRKRVLAWVEYQMVADALHFGVHHN